MRSDDSPQMTRGVLLRIIGLALAVALAGVAAWLIVTGTDSPRRVQVGVLAGLWSALLGAFSMYGARRTGQPVEVEPVRTTSTELEVRSAQTQLERAEEVAARRAHEARLEQLLRAEVQSAIAREVNSLRVEIAELRSDLLEKVGNQVRLERIETTRVIGSDLEALQQEVRRLQEVSRDPMPIVRPIIEPARVRPVSREAAESAVPEPQPAPEQAAVREPEPEQAAPRPSTPPAETTGPIRIEQDARPAPEPRPLPSPSPSPEREPVILPMSSDERVDTLSGLPRIEPFTAFELDPIETEPDYTGRRRRTENDSAARPPEQDTGRRHRADDDGDDLLARLLAREGR